MERLLREIGFSVVEDVATATGARMRMLTTAYNVVVLDLQLPDGNGVSLLNALRRAGRDTPVLVVAGTLNNDVAVLALDAGADDAIRKPIEPNLFQARVRALVRRGGAKRTEQLIAGNVALNRLAHEVYVGTELVYFSAREFAFLEYFLMRVGEVVPRSALLMAVLELAHDPGTNVIDVNIARLRRKLASARATVRISSLRGVGFVLPAGKKK